MFDNIYYRCPNGQKPLSSLQTGIFLDRYWMQMYEWFSSDVIATMLVDENTRWFPEPIRRTIVAATSSRQIELNLTVKINV